MSKAIEIVEAVQAVERIIARQIAAVINEGLSELTKATGLSIGGVSVEFIDENSYSESGQMLKLCKVHIDARLPEPPE